MARKIYTNKGICIFCGKSVPEVTFNHKPHILPKSMGGTIIGVDICDDCNEYFGSTDNLILSPPRFAVEVCVKEVMNISRHFFLKQFKKKREKLSSMLFNYYDSEKLLEFKQRNWQTYDFQSFFARQFKRGMFELFLQAYHFKTGNGLDSKFDCIRRFARYNEGDAKLFYVFNRGIYLVDENYMQHPRFSMSDCCIEEIENHGFYTIHFNGHFFLLEVVPQTEEDRNTYLKKMCDEHSIGGGIYAYAQEVTYINDIDFTLSTLYNTKHK